MWGWSVWRSTYFNHRHRSATQGRSYKIKGFVWTFFIAAGWSIFTYVWGNKIVCILSIDTEAPHRGDHVKSNQPTSRNKKNYVQIVTYNPLFWPFPRWRFSDYGRNTWNIIPSTPHRWKSIILVISTLGVYGRNT